MEVVGNMKRSAGTATTRTIVEAFQIPTAALRAVLDRHPASQFARNLMRRVGRQALECADPRLLALRTGALARRDSATERT